MRKILLVAAVIGLVAIPSFVVARHRADDNNKQAEDTKQVDRQDNQSNDTPGIKVENEAALPSGSISKDKAVEIAKGAQPGKSITKIEIETEEGTVVYSVRFSDGSRVDVRASDGQIVRSDAGAGGSSGSGNDDSGSNGSGGGSGSSGGSGRDHPEDSY